MDAFRNNFQDINTSLKLDGFYRGIVEDIEDPWRMGRARIRIYGVHTPKVYPDDCEGIPTEQLPWADQVAPLVGGNSGAGVFAVPLPGTVVYCFFERGDPMHPRYFGTLMGKTPQQTNAKTNPIGTNTDIGAGNSDTPNKNAVSNAKNMCDAAKELGVDPCKVKAISDVESGGSGFGVDGRPKIRFEQHYFAKRIGPAATAQLNDPSIAGFTKNAQGHSPGGSWSTFDKAAAINRNAAIESCSWGKYQVMGANWKTLGFSSAEDFMNCVSDPNNQEQILTNFIQTKPGLLNALKNDDWDGVARGYNGANYAQGNYQNKLKNAYNSCKKNNSMKSCEENQGNENNSGVTP